jgi:uncharacterized protein YhjY with autotransporter beta-barrel domain
MLASESHSKGWDFPLILLHSPMNRLHWKQLHWEQYAEQAERNL